MTAYVADSSASAPAPRGLPLSIQAPLRHSSAPAADVVRASAVLQGGEEWEQGEAVVATEPPPSDDGPSLEELEAQMPGDVSGGATAERDVPPRAARRPRQAAGDGDEPATGALPELDTLVGRLPADVRGTLDELFRARFVAVKRVPASALQARTNKKADGAV